MEKSLFNLEINLLWIFKQKNEIRTVIKDGSTKNREEKIKKSNGQKKSIKNPRLKCALFKLR